MANGKDEGETTEKPDENKSKSSTAAKAVGAAAYAVATSSALVNIGQEIVMTANQGINPVGGFASLGASIVDHGPPEETKETAKEKSQNDSTHRVRPIK